MNKYSSSIMMKRYFYGLFLTSLFSGILYISGITGVLSLILSLIIYSLIAFFIYNIWKNLRKKNALSYGDFLEYFLYKVSWGIGISILIVGGISYYKNEVSPTPMPSYYLTNGDKEVVFQAMSHIGTENFYQEVKNKLLQKKQQGYVYYFEGVKDGSQENKNNFNEAMGIKFDENLYENFSKLYGVTHQDNSIYYGLENNLDYNIDLSIDEIMSFYKKSNTNAKKSSFLQNQEVLDVNTEIVKTLSTLNNKELALLRYINKAMLNLIIGSENTQNFVKDNFANKQLFKIILDKRNEVLAQEVIHSEHKKIFITYGLLHFKGFYSLLQKNDTKWKITQVDNLYPIK